MLNNFCEIHCFWHFQNFQAWCLQTPIIRFFHFWIVYSYYSRPFLQNRPRSGTNKRQLWRFTSVLHVTLCCFTLQHCISLQEHLNYVTEISQDELFILDPELVTKETVGTSPGMPGAMETVGGCSNSTDQFAFPACSAGPSPLCR